MGCSQTVSPFQSPMQDTGTCLHFENDNWNLIENSLSKSECVVSRHEPRAHSNLVHCTCIKIYSLKNYLTCCVCLQQYISFTPCLNEYDRAQMWCGFMRFLTLLTPHDFSWDCAALLILNYKSLRTWQSNEFS